MVNRFEKKKQTRNSNIINRFNVCCLLGLSCLSISFGVCLLPLINDLATFYLTSIILGCGLAISYNGKTILID